MSDESPKVEFFANNGIIEIRYFDTPKDELYRSWKLPESIAHELIAWWINLKKNKEITFPLQKRTKVCELTMHTEKNIEIKSLDCLGRTNMTGWSLPAVVVEKLAVRQKDTADK
ncbi:MAG: hypothetical protein Q8R05_02370 [Candidatus Omnitrophota bacterium]|nr:hypothetical protein [Candidatus Omnitrophota bacterium]